jgi:hypothetical protein
MKVEVMVNFSPFFWYWLVGLFALFLPVELFAAIHPKGRGEGGTFSEFVWWAFGVKPRPDGKPVRYAGGRHVVLVAMCAALLAHFGFGFTFIPVAVCGLGVAVVLVRAVFWERKS